MGLKITVTEKKIEVFGCFLDKNAVEQILTGGSDFCAACGKKKEKFRLRSFLCHACDSKSNAVEFVGIISAIKNFFHENKKGKVEIQDINSDKKSKKDFFHYLANHGCMILSDSKSILTPREVADELRSIFSNQDRKTLDAAASSAHKKFVRNLGDKEEKIKQLFNIETAVIIWYDDHPDSLEETDSVAGKIQREYCQDAGINIILKEVNRKQQPIKQEKRGAQFRRCQTVIGEFIQANESISQPFELAMAIWKEVEEIKNEKIPFEVLLAACNQKYKGARLRLCS